MLLEIELLIQIYISKVWYSLLARALFVKMMILDHSILQAERCTAQHRLGYSTALQNQLMQDQLSQDA